MEEHIIIFQSLHITLLLKYGSTGSEIYLLFFFEGRLARLSY